MVPFRPLIEWVSWATLGQGILAYHLHFFFLLLFFVVKRCLRCVASIYVCMRMSTHHGRACKSQRATFRSLFSPSITHFMCMGALPTCMSVYHMRAVSKKTRRTRRGCCILWRSCLSSSGFTFWVLVVELGSLGWLQVPLPDESACWPQIGFLSLLF